MLTINFTFTADKITDVKDAGLHFFHATQHKCKCFDIFDYFPLKFMIKY